MAAVAARSASPRLTLPRDQLWEWYADESGGGKASCCVEDGAEPGDKRTVAPPPQVRRRRVRGQAAPAAVEDTWATTWTAAATATVTLDIADVSALLAQAETTLNDDGERLVDPNPPLIHSDVAEATDDATPCPTPGTRTPSCHA